MFSHVDVGGTSTKGRAGTSLILLKCNGEYQYCELENTATGKDEIIEIDGRNFRCATKGLVECEEHRERVGAETWLKEKKEQEAELMKQAMHAAGQQAKYQSQQREIATAAAKVKANAAMDAANLVGGKEVELATLKGNAPLPDPVADKLMAQLKTKMRKIKFELQDREKIFETLRHVKPACSDMYDKCTSFCDKNEPEMELGALEIMGKVTPCQMKCKNDVVSCVMTFVSTTYKDVTVEAMAAAQTPAAR